MEVLRPGGHVLTVTANGYGKRTDLEEYRIQSRGGYGIINIQASERNGPVVGISCVTGDDELMLITQQGQILRIRTGTIRPIGRATQGVRLIVVEEGDKVVSIVRVADSGINGDEPNGEPVEGEGRSRRRSARLTRPEAEASTDGGSGATRRRGVRPSEE